MCKRALKIPQKSPAVSAKESCNFCQNPANSVKEPCNLRKRALQYLQKSPANSAKEPCNFSMIAFYKIHVVSHPTCVAVPHGCRVWRFLADICKAHPTHLTPVAASISLVFTKLNQFWVWVFQVISLLWDYLTSLLWDYLISLLWDYDVRVKVSQKWDFCKNEFKNGQISKSCFVFQVILVISSAKFSSAEEVDLSFISWIWIHGSDFKGFFWEDCENVFLSNVLIRGWTNPLHRHKVMSVGYQVKQNLKSPSWTHF